MLVIDVSIKRLTVWGMTSKMIQDGNSEDPDQPGLLIRVFTVVFNTALAKEFFVLFCFSTEVGISRSFCYYYYFFFFNRSRDIMHNSR